MEKTVEAEENRRRGKEISVNVSADFNSPAGFVREPDEFLVSTISRMRSVSLQASAHLHLLRELPSVNG